MTPLFRCRLIYSVFLSVINGGRRRSVDDKDNDSDGRARIKAVRPKGDSDDESGERCGDDDREVCRCFVSLIVELKQ